MVRWTAANSEGYEAPVALAVDAVVLTVREEKLQVLVVPWPAGGQALPGGLVRPTETAAFAVTRKLKKKTGVSGVYLEQLQTFTRPTRDKRGWIPSVAHLALVPPDTTPPDPSAQWADARKSPRLIYDHNQIVKVALDRVAGKLWWSNIAVGILPGSFTFPEARTVYDAIAGSSHNAGTFGRDLLATGLIEPTGEELRGPRGRPAGLYRFRNAEPAWGVGRRKRAAPTE